MLAGPYRASKQACGIKNAPKEPTVHSHMRKAVGKGQQPLNPARRAGGLEGI